MSTVQDRPPNFREEGQIRHRGFGWWLLRKLGNLRARRRT